MNIIEESSKIPEIYMLCHKHDTKNNDDGFDYSENLLKRTVSPILYNNKNNESFLNKLNNLLVIMFDSSLPVRNIFYYSINKFYNKHGK